MGTLGNDVKLALRRLFGNPGFSILAVLTLAVTIGANTAVFSVVNAVLLRPLPYERPDRLVQIRNTTPDPDLPEVPLSYPNFLDLEAAVKGLSQMAGSVPRPYLLTGDGPAEQLRGAKVTSGFFDVFGVEPVLGRAILPEEDEPGAERVAVLSYGLWQRRFGGDPGILGRSIQLDGMPHTVVGVMPETWSVRLEDSQVWSALALDPQAFERDTRFLQAYGRLAPGVSLEQAQSELATLMQGLDREYPDANQGLGILLRTRREQVLGDISHLLVLFTVAVGLVLLIGCVNLANLLLARSLARRKEMAMRGALGAGRWRIVRQLLVESLVLSLLGGAFGFLLTFGAVRLLNAFDPGTIPRADEVSVDLNVLAFTLLVAVVASLLFGLVPALYSARSDLRETLIGGAGTSTGNRREGRFQGGLVVLQVALTVVLLVGAGLLLKSFATLMAVDPGFDTRGLLTFQLNPNPNKFEDAEPMLAFYRDLLERLDALPGVEADGAAAFLPFTQWASGAFSVVGQPVTAGNQPMAERNAVTPGYFDAMGIRLLDGRGFSSTDTGESAPVVIVNQTLARRFFPDGRAVGRQIKMGPADEDGTVVAVIGVVEDVRQQGLDVEVEPKIYNVHPQAAWASSMTVVMRTSLDDPLSLTDAVRRQVMALDDTLPVANVKTMQERVTDSVRGARFNTLLLTIFGAVALLLTAVGIYGVVAHGVGRRQREIGIRLSLGASRREITRLIVGRQSLPILGGLLIGFVVAILAGRLIASWLYGVAPTDAVTFVGVGLVLLAAGVLASYLPSRRAQKVDPARVLREG